MAKVRTMVRLSRREVDQAVRQYARMKAASQAPDALAFEISAEVDFQSTEDHTVAFAHAVVAWDVDG